VQFRVEGRDGYNAQWVFVRRGETAPCFFTEELSEPFPVVIGHAEGRFVSREPGFLTRMQDRENRTLYYCTPDGDEATAYPWNPNGAMGALAGLHGLDGQVLAFMPHPERCVEAMIGGTDGRFIFQSLIEHVEAEHAVA